MWFTEELYLKVHPPPLFDSVQIEFERCLEVNNILRNEK